MVKLSLPKNPILKRALAGLLVFVLGMVTVGVLTALDNRDRDRPESARKLLTQAVWQYGPTSQQVKDVLTQMGQEAGGKGIVALLDPNTGAALVAYPPELTGKKPDEMTLPGGIKLPALPLMQAKGRFSLERFRESEGGGIDVQTQAIFPWFDKAEYGVPADGYRTGKRAYPSPKDGARAWSRRMDDGGPGQPMTAVPAPAAPAAPPAPPAPAPTAILLTAYPHQLPSVWQIAAMAAGAVAFLGFVLYWLSVAWWVFDDARKRQSNRAVIWGALALITNLVGVLVYLIARREQAMCQACGTPVEKSFSHCPHCGNQLKYACVECGAPLKDGWNYCAKCGHPRGE